MENTNLQVIIFIAGINGAIEALQPSIAELVGSNNLEVFRTITKLAHRLRQSMDNSTVAILVAATKEDLADILALHTWLERVKVILVLPDYEIETIAQGHKLRPRFLTVLGGNLQEVVAVLKKMLAYDHSTMRRKSL
jgi:hypothetical protein